MWISARPESNSYIPASKMPTTVNRFRRGSTAAGVTSPWGAIKVTLSPTWARRAWASSSPRTMPNEPGASASRLPTRMYRAKSATVSSSDGSTPRTSVPRTASSRESMPCACT